jgi:Hus1-like protein
LHVGGRFVALDKTCCTLSHQVGFATPCICCFHEVAVVLVVIIIYISIMRFRAKLAAEHVNLLNTMLAPISRLAVGGPGESSLLRNGSILYLDEDYMRLSVRGKSADTNGILCYSELKAAGGIFLEHRIESNAEKNAIVMELDLSQFKTALQSMQADKYDESTLALQEHNYTILKLAKRGSFPCLSLESSGLVQVHHYIPIRVLRSSEWADHVPPTVSLPTVQLMLGPAQSSLRTIMDRLRSLSPTVYIQGRLEAGDLTVRVDTDGASLRTYFPHVAPQVEGCAPHSPGHGQVKVDTKKLHACLQWQMYPQIVSCALLCLVENEMLVMHVSLQPSAVGFFTYYVPVHYISNEPGEE